MNSLFSKLLKGGFALCVGVLFSFSTVWGQLVATPGPDVCKSQNNNIIIDGSHPITDPNRVHVTSGGLSWSLSGPPGDNIIVDVTNSTVGSYVIIDTLPNNQTDQITVNIGEVGTSDFYFNTSKYCISDSLVSPQTVSPPGGMFSSVGATNTTVDGLTGEIDLISSFVHPDSSHQIVYTITNQHCVSSDTEQIQIKNYTSEFDIDPLGNNLCFSPGDSITLTNISGPGAFRFIYGSTTTNPISNSFPNPTTLFDTSVTLQIPSNIPTGSNSISYTLFQAVATCSDTDTVPLLIGLPPTTTISYPTNFYCQNDSNIILPIISPMPPSCNNCGIWSSNMQGFSTIDGSFSPSNANPGIYAITYTYNHPHGCSDTFFVDSIEISPTIQSNIAYPDTFCRTGNQEIPLDSVFPQGGNIIYPPIFGISPTNGLLISALPDQPSDRSFEIIYQPPPNGCILPDTEVVVIRQLLGTYSYQDTSLCQADGLEIAMGNASFNATSVLYFKESPTNDSLSIDPLTGVIDPAASDPAIYKVGMALTHGMCSDTFYADQKVNIWENPSLGFSLPSEICTFDSNITIIADTTGGIFFASGPNSNALAIDSGGTITVNQSGIHSYIINYSLHTLNCPVDTSVIFTINDTVRSSFVYPQDTFCSTSTTNLLPIPIGLSGGSYAASDSTIIDPQTGALIPNGASGSYIIYRMLDSVLCAVPDSVTIQINQGNSAFFEYPETDYCSSGGIINVDTMTLAGLGGFFSYQNLDTLSTDTLAITTTTGAIDLQASANEAFLITYHLPGTQFCPDRQTALIRIVAEDSITSFTISDDTICQGSNPLLLELGPGSDSTGRFFSVQNGVGINSGQDNVTFENWFNGTATIGYALGGVCRDTFLSTVEVNPFDTAFLAYQDSIICSSELPYSPSQFGLNPGVFSINTTDYSIDPISGRIFQDSTDEGGTINAEITYTTAIQCPATTTYNLRIENPWPRIPAVISPDSVVCEGVEVTVTTNWSGNIEYYVNNSLYAVNSPSFSILDSLRPINIIEIIQEPNSRCPNQYWHTIVVKPTPTVTTPIDTMTLSAGSDLTIPFASNIDLTQVQFWSDTVGPVWAEPRMGITDTTASDSTTSIDLSFFTSNELVPGTVTFFASPVSQGCRGDTTAIAFDINPGTDPIYVPEVLSPNGDGWNDRWVIRWNSDIVPEDYTMHVFNASHGEVGRFPIREEWSATTVPDGVYWWLLKDRNAVVVQSGGLTIRRN